MNKPRRVTIFAGHYGSGKTTVAVNWALRLAEMGKRAAIVDLDIVNPYFRTKDASGMLADAGVSLIASPFAGTNVDAPALPAAAYAAVADKSAYAVLDVGGDDRGALALGRYRPAILAENDYEFLCVVNRFRPLTGDAASALDVMREIQAACGMAFTGIVNNSNLGRETSPETVRQSLAYAREIAQAAQLPLRFTCAYQKLAEALGDIADVFALRQVIKTV